MPTHCLLHTLTSTVCLATCVNIMFTVRHHSSCICRSLDWVLALKSIWREATSAQLCAHRAENFTPCFSEFLTPFVVSKILGECHSSVTPCIADASMNGLHGSCEAMHMNVGIQLIFHLRKAYAHAQPAQILWWLYAAAERSPFPTKPLTWFERVLPSTYSANGNLTSCPSDLSDVIERPKPLLKVKLRGLCTAPP